MLPTCIAGEREYGSGDIVEPGTYVDVESGAIVQVKTTDELPEGNRVVRYRRKFRKISHDRLEQAKLQFRIRG